MTGQDIKRARTAANVNQTELAKALGLVDRCGLTDIEAGRIDCTDAWILHVMSVIHGISIGKQSETTTAA